MARFGLQRHGAEGGGILIRYFFACDKFKEKYLTKNIVVYAVSVLRWLKYMFGMDVLGGAIS